MLRTVSTIIADIESFRPSQDWLGLDQLLQELFQRPDAVKAVDALLDIFERFPDEDGAGVFWGIVHGLESLPGYEPKLIERVRERPTEFTVMMVGRLLNAGVTEVGDTSPRILLTQVASSNLVAPRLRELARKFADRPKDRAP